MQILRTMTFAALLLPSAIFAQANAPGQQAPAVPPPAAVAPPSSGPTMAETIAFIKGKFEEQKAVHVSHFDGKSTEDPDLTQTLELKGQCKATATTLPFLVLRPTDLSLSSMDPRDIKVVSFTEWKEVGPPAPLSDMDFDINRRTEWNYWQYLRAHSTTPELYLIVHEQLRFRTPVIGAFSDKRIAERVATAYIHAISLCHKAEAF